jgi:hypothetical protein
MKSWQFVVAGLVCLAAAACRTDPNIMLLERELRFQEDQLYQLKESLEDSQAALESCRRENATLRSQSQGGEAASGLRGLGRAATATGPGAISSRAPAESTPVAPPAVNHGTETQPGEVPETLKGRPNRQSPGKTSTRATPRPAPAPGPSAELSPGPVLPGLGETRDAAGGAAVGGNLSVGKGDSRRVSKIVLNPTLTGGYNGGGRSGDAGVMLVIEPRDAQGRYVDAPADVSVVVIDPAVEGEAARVARWDLAAADVALLFRQTALGRGIELEMPWPDAPPAHTDLHLFVRYTTSDGRRLEASQPIKIDLRRGLSTRWVPADQALPAGSSAAAAQTARAEEPWRRASAPADHLAEAPPSRTARGNEPSLRTATLPSSRAGGSPSQSAEPRLQRPVWSPERP